MKYLEKNMSMVFNICYLGPLTLVIMCLIIHKERQ